MNNTILSRKEAIEQGLKFYFTGKPCPRQHFCKRYCSGRACVECTYENSNKIESVAKRKISGKKWELKNKERKRSTNQALSNKYPERRLWESARRRALKKNLPFSISIEDIKYQIPSDLICPILGIPIGRQIKKISPNSMTLDRIIPKLGYVPGNICVISNRANAIKNTETDPQAFRK